MQLLELDPPSGERLHRRDALHVRIGYRSTQPVRFQIAGFVKGTRITQTSSSTTPAYPAGNGEAIAWFEPHNPVYLDEVRIIVLDQQWQPLHTLATPVNFLWDREPSATARQPAAWVSALSDEQQTLVHAPKQPAAVGDGIDHWSWLIMLMGWSIPGYIALQIFLLRRYREGWRTAALAPLALMIPLLGYTLIALLAQSNLWPLMLLMLTPIAFVYLAVLALIYYVQRRRSKSAA